MSSHTVMMVAAEASSALFAERLLQHWKKNKKEIKAFGVGTLSMEEQGFERLGKSEEMAVVGIAEIVENYGKLRGIFDQLVAEAEKRRPQVVVLLDYPDFNLMLAKKLHALGLQVVYYISPQVWAWRQGRVEKIKQYCKKVLVLFPFEMEFYQKAGVPVEFVGHPILDELDEKYFDPKNFKHARNRRGIQDDEIVIGLMPGSRRSELKQNFHLQIETAKKVYKKYLKVRILIMVAPTFTKEQVQAYLEKEDVRFPYILLKEEPFEMIHIADYILVASGTATLMVGLLHKPMVIMYKMKWLTGVMAKVLVRGVKFFGLVNLIMGREVVPERWQEGANPEELARLLGKYIEDPSFAEKVRQDLMSLQQKLGDKGATRRVAEALEEYLK